MSKKGNVDLKQNSNRYVKINNIKSQDFQDYPRRNIKKQQQQLERQNRLRQVKRVNNVRTNIIKQLRKILPIIFYNLYRLY